MERAVTRTVRVFPDLGAAIPATAQHLFHEALGAARSRGRFTWVLAGGRTPEGLYRHLAHRYRARFPWSETEVFFGDERCVSPRSQESNYAMAREALLARVPLRRGRIHRLEGELRPPSAAAARYARTLGPISRGGGLEGARFDVVLLGIGPDGHTASLFPRSPALHEGRRAVVAIRRSGQPPFVPRLTMTLSAIASSREVLFLVAGADKAEAVERIFTTGPHGSPDWPASLVRSAGPVVWFLDRAAASRLPKSFRTEAAR